MVRKSAFFVLVSSLNTAVCFSIYAFEQVCLAHIPQTAPGTLCRAVKLVNPGIGIQVAAAAYPFQVKQRITVRQLV
jgi:hypothetical protein